MAIDGFDKRTFAQQLNSYLFPSQPINSSEHLHGRIPELNRIERALYASGRHVFIYGDRGVGKSSLAATAANQYQSTDAEYIDVSGHPDATLVSIVANIAYQALKRITGPEKKVKSLGSVNLKVLKFERSTELTFKDVEKKINDLGDALEVLKDVAHIHSASPIVVLDEFDRIDSIKERNRFADLLKHLGDKKVNIKFIITGIAKSLNELLGAHQSAIRQLETIELPRLSWDARWDIVVAAAEAFNLRIDREICIRIAAVCDGYPYYAHLIGEKILWSVFDDQKKITDITWDHYYDGLNTAIESISAELRRPYELAINQKTGDYEEVLWATADSEWLQRYVKDMYSSYEQIMKNFPGKEVLNKNQFGNRIRSLRAQSLGSVLQAENRQGLYSYREKMLRGYVRMQAEAHGIELIGEDVAKGQTQFVHVPTKVSSGYHQPRIPKGVNFNRNR